MADEHDIRGETDLIDISDVPTEFDETDELGERTADEITPLPAPPMVHSSGLAPLRDRFAAALLDAAFLHLLYWTLGIIYRAIAVGTARGPIPLTGLHGLIFHLLFFLIVLALFTLLEGILFATPGKLLCRLRVVAADGERSSFKAAFLRNLLRPVDLLLMLAIVGFIIIEKTRWHQRIGDLIAKTIVVSKARRAAPSYALSFDMLASASGRLTAGLIDLALLLGFVGGYALLLSPETPTVSQFFLLLAPIAIFFFIALPELLWQTSPGKWIFGYVICHEDGSRVGIGSITIRTLLGIVDVTPFGFLSMLISPRAQILGDAATGSVVIKTKRSWKGLLGLLFFPLIVASFIVAGMENRDNFLSPSFRINFLPSFDMTGGRALGQGVARPTHLRLRELRFSDTSGGERTPPIFKPGETALVTFHIEGYTKKGKEAWIREDLLVRYPNDDVALKLENIIDFRQKLEKEGPVELTNRVALPRNAPEGRYTITITIHDMHATRQLKEQRFFYASFSPTS